MARRPLRRDRASRSLGFDFITIDSADGGTGAAPMSLIDYVGLPVKESPPRVADMLATGAAAHPPRRRQTDAPAEVAWALCAGADFVVSARGFMLALGCIQACSATRTPVRPASPRTTPASSAAWTSPTRRSRALRQAHAQGTGGDRAFLRRGAAARSEPRSLSDRGPGGGSAPPSEPTCPSSATPDRAQGYSARSNSTALRVLVSGSSSALRVTRPCTVPLQARRLLDASTMSRQVPSCSRALPCRRPGTDRRDRCGSRSSRSRPARNAHRGARRHAAHFPTRFEIGVEIHPRIRRGLVVGHALCFERGARPASVAPSRRTRSPRDRHRGDRPRRRCERRSPRSHRCAGYRRSACSRSRQRGGKDRQRSAADQTGQVSRDDCFSGRV